MRCLNHRRAVSAVQAAMQADELYSGYADTSKMPADASLSGMEGNSGGEDALSDKRKKKLELNRIASRVRLSARRILFTFHLRCD